MRVREQGGFTLIELLVVMSIIAVLASILFPAISKARDRARVATCISNQHHIATTFVMNAQETEDILPASADAWKSLGLPNEMLMCPSQGKTRANGYVYNDLMAGKALGEIADPTTAVLVADGTHYAGTPAGSVNNVAYSQTDIDYRRHSDRAIIAFSDAHVESRTCVPLVSPMVPVVSGLAVCLDAGLLPVVADNTPVSDWSEGAIGSNAVQSTISAQPLYQSASSAYAVNGKPVLLFDGVDDYLQASNKKLEVLNDFSFFIVFKMTNQVSGRGVFSMLAGNPAGADSAALDAFSFSQHDPATRQVQFQKGGATPATNISQMSDGFGLFEAHMSGDAGTLKTAVDANSTFTTMNYNLQASLANTKGYGISARFTGATPQAGAYGANAIAEILLYKRALSANERTQMVRYLKSKYAL